MSKIKYTVAKTTVGGKTTYYASPVSAGTLTINEIAQEVAQNTTYERSTVKAIIEEMEEVIKRNVLRGFRCQIGEDFLTVYPNLKASVSDTDPEKVSAKQVTARDAKSRLGCTVSTKFSAKFAQDVQWQKVDKTGAIVEDDDITDTPDTPATPTPGGNEMD